MNKITILRWTIALLIVFNLATIGTIIYHNVHEHNNCDSFLFEPDSEPLNGAYFRQKLDFDNSQMKVYRTSSRIFRKNANSIISEINEQKKMMLNELVKPVSNEQVLEEIADSIGMLHSDLKKVTVNFYLDLKEICNEDQQQKLKEIFVPLFRNTPTQRGTRNVRSDSQCTNI